MSGNVVDFTRYRRPTSRLVRIGDRVRVKASSNLGVVQEILPGGYLRVRLMGGIVRRVAERDITMAPVPFGGEA
jgi:hypothetical protein